MTAGSVAWFIAAAITEIGGACLVWLGGSRTTGACFPVFTVGSLVRAVAFDGFPPPDTTLVCLVGVGDRHVPPLTPVGLALDATRGFGVATCGSSESVVPHITREKPRWAPRGGLRFRAESDGASGGAVRAYGRRGSPSGELPASWSGAGDLSPAGNHARSWEDASRGRHSTAGC